MSNGIKLRIFLIGFITGAILPLISHWIIPSSPPIFWAFFPPLLIASLFYRLFGVLGLLIHGVLLGFTFATFRALSKRSPWWILVFVMLYAALVYWLLIGWLDDLTPTPLSLPE